MLHAPLRTEIFVVRHAEVHNPKDIVYGRLPRFRLSQKGVQQADMAARFLSVRDIDAIYTSPLLRARQTAASIARYHPRARIHVDRKLIEVRTGYQGQPNSILKPGFSFYEPPVREDDETMQDVCDRMMSALQDIALRHAGSVTAVISHGDPISILRLGLEGTVLDTAHLHRTVYAARTSIMHVIVEPQAPLRLTYFDVADEGAG